MEIETNNMTPLLDTRQPERTYSDQEGLHKTYHNGCYFHYQLIIHYIQKESFKVYIIQPLS